MYGVGLIAIVVCSSACAPDDGVVLPCWTLHSLDGTERPLKLPVHVDDLKTPTRYELTRTVTLPATWANHDLTVAWPHFEGVANLWVNGTQMLPYFSNARGRHQGLYRWRLDPAHTATPVLHLRITIDHTTFHSGRLDTVPVLSLSDAEPWPVTWVEWVNTYLMVGALAVMWQVALTYLVLARSNRAYLWIGLEMALSSTLPMDTLGLLARLCGAWDTPVLGVSLVTASLASVYFLHSQFTLPPPGRPWRYGLYVVLALVFLGMSPPSRMLDDATLLYIVTTSAHNLWTCIRLARRPNAPPTAYLVGGCWALMMTLSVPDMTAWAGLGEITGGVRTSGVGLGLFALLQSGILIYAHMQSLQQSAQLNTELRDVNQELRRQIGDRSRQLYNALALTGASQQRMLRLDPGQVVQNRYRVMRHLGEGGMGYVYEVQRLADSKSMALKVAQGLDGSSLARLAREAALAVQVNHPNVVSLLDVDVADAGFVYVVMELVDGVSLELCKHHFVGRAEAALGIATQLADGLGALHRANIVHRDLKPANALLTYSNHEDRPPHVKIVDFGISRNISLDAAPLPVMVTSNTWHSGSTQEDLLRQSTLYMAPGSTPSTQSGHIPGTPRYMGPELADGNDTVSPASDVFSLGLIAYELLSGAYPFVEPPVLTCMRGRAPTVAAPLPPRVRDVMPAPVVQALMDCLALDPQRRPSPSALTELWTPKGWNK